MILFLRQKRSTTGKSFQNKIPYNDPADRFIAATAWENDLILITEDEKLKKSTLIKIMSGY